MFWAAPARPNFHSIFDLPPSVGGHFSFVIIVGKRIYNRKIIWYNNEKLAMAR
jgi:hypothetical protein